MIIAGSLLCDCQSLYSSCGSYPSQWPGKCRSTSSRWTRWWLAGCAGRCPPPTANSCWPSRCTASSPWHHDTTSQPDTQHRTMVMKVQTISQGYYLCHSTKRKNVILNQSSIEVTATNTQLQLSWIKSKSDYSTIQILAYDSSSGDNDCFRAQELFNSGIRSYFSLCNTFPMSLCTKRNTYCAFFIVYCFYLMWIDAEAMPFVSFIYLYLYCIIYCIFLWCK